MRIPVKRTHALITVILCAGISLVRIFINSNRNDVTGSTAYYSNEVKRLLRSVTKSDSVTSSSNETHIHIDYDYVSDEKEPDEVVDFKTEQNSLYEASDGVLNEQDDLDSENILELLEIDEGEYENEDELSSEYGENLVGFKKKIIGHKKSPSGPRQQYVTNRLNGFIREVSNCNSTLYSGAERQKNLLCATPETIMDYSSVDSYAIKGVNSPCFFLRQSNRERGDRGWNFRLTSSNINLLDGGKTLNMYKLNCLPGAYLAGFPKSGTTELHARLSEHHQVHGALRKEVSWLDNGKSYEQFFGPNGESTLLLYAYMRMFGGAAQSIENEIVLRQAKLLENELKRSDAESSNPRRRKETDSSKNKDDILSRSVLLDSSPGNYDIENLRKIAHMLPNSKIIFIMRDPVDREFSKYRFHFQLSNRRKFSEKNQNPDAFHRYVVQQLNQTFPMKTSTSRYHIYIEAALKYFKRENILFLMFEEFIKNPLDLIEKSVLPFLGLDPYEGPTRRRILKELKAGEHANTSKKSYKMHYKTRILLMKYFSPFNRRLADVLGDDMWTWGY